MKIELTEEQQAKLPPHWHPLKALPWINMLGDDWKHRFVMAKRVGGLACVFVAWWYDPDGTGGVWNADRTIIDFHREMTLNLLETFDHPGVEP